MAKIWRQETRLWEVPLCATADSFFTALPNKHSWDPDCVTNKHAKFCTYESEPGKRNKQTQLKIR